MSKDVETFAVLARERIAARFEQIVAEARQKSYELRLRVEDLEKARGTLAWEVHDLGTVYLNIAEGRMSVAETPLEEAFMLVEQSRADWERFANGLLRPGFMMAGHHTLGHDRIQRLREITGSVRFIVTGFGDGDWITTLHFGPPPRPQFPQTTVHVSAATLELVETGKLDPQAAFMKGEIRLEGDMGLAMQVVAALSI